MNGFVHDELPQVGRRKKETFRGFSPQDIVKYSRTVYAKASGIKKKNNKEKQLSFFFGAI